MTAGVWDASTSSLLKQVGLNPTVTTAAARIAELEQMQRYEMRKQSALMHLRIANLKHTFGESFEEDETYERGVLGPTLLEKRRKEAGMGRDDNDEQRRRVAADADIVGRPRRSSDSVLPPMLSDERLSSSQQLRVGSLSERELRGSENGYQVDSRLLRPAGSMKHKKPLVAKARSSGDTQPSTSGNSPYPPVMGRPPQAGSYVDNLSTLLDGVARL